MHMKDKINTYVNDIKKFFNKDITEQVTKYRIPLVAGVVVILLACISIFVTYAFYQVEAVTPIVGGSTGDIADIELRVMVEDRNTDDINSENYGTAIEGEYVLYPYIPEAGYEYNAGKSYCTNGSTLSYDPNTYEVDITAYGHDVCYMYFDSTANLDITLRVYAENVDAVSGEGTGNYTQLETTTMPSIGYELNQEKTTCTSNATVSYLAAENMFSVEATGKAECDVYMDALNVDIALKVYLQDKSGSSEYYEADSIPTNYYYEINSEKSSCTGTSTLSLDNQRVVVAATSRTSCVAYLDVTSGPIMQSMSLAAENNIATLSLEDSNVGTNAAMYYYSADGGDTYVSSTDSTYTFNDTAATTFKAYSVDSAGKESGILTTTTEDTYVYNGAFPYSSGTQSITIEQSGYYYLEVWGAQGGSYNSDYAIGGMGGYSKGYIYLNAGDTLYIHTGGAGGYGTSLNNLTGGGVNGGGDAGYRGGAGGGATDIRIGADTLLNRVIVAGGGGGAAVIDDTYKANGGAGGGIAGLDGEYYSANHLGYVGTGGMQIAGGTGGTGIGTDYNGSSGTFGLGGNSANRNNVNSNGAGGGGWYGGGGAGNGDSSNYAAGGGGGSGFIYTASAELPADYAVASDYYLSSANAYVGNTTFIGPNGITETGHSENGYAKVTYVGQTLP